MTKPVLVTERRMLADKVRMLGASSPTSYVSIVHLIDKLFPVKLIVLSQNCHCCMMSCFGRRESVTVNTH